MAALSLPSRQEGRTWISSSGQPYLPRWEPPPLLSAADSPRAQLRLSPGRQGVPPPSASHLKLTGEEGAAICNPDSLGLLLQLVRLPSACCGLQRSGWVGGWACVAKSAGSAPQWPVSLLRISPQAFSKGATLESSSSGEAVRLQPAPLPRASGGAFSRGAWLAI